MEHQEKKIKNSQESRLKKLWNFLKEDSWQSWAVSLILIVLFIKLIFFPVLSFITKSPLPLVVVESCSMYHESEFDEWWEKNRVWYESKGISEKMFESFPMKNGLNKGDIIVVWGRSETKVGDIIIFESKTKYPIIHRVIYTEPLTTKGDHNSDHLPNGIEENIQKDAVVGEAVARIPLLGWVKLIFFEPLKKAEARGFCS